MSDLKYQGRAFIRINGQEIPTLDGATLTPGGETRAPVVGYGVYGFKTAMREAAVTFSVPNGGDDMLFLLKNAVDATIEFVTDLGKSFLLARAWSTGEESLNADGSISSTFNAVEAKEI